MKVLVLENPLYHTVIRSDLFESVLKRRGYEVTLAKDVATANVELGDHGPFDYVVIHHAGFEDLRLLKARYHQPPLYIGYSGANDIPDFREALEHLYDHVLFSPSRIVDIIEQKG